MFGIKNFLVITLVVCLATAGVQYVPPLIDESPQIWGKFFVSEVKDATITQSITVQIDKERITVTGCNIHTSTFAYDSFQKDYTVGLFASTRKACLVEDQALIVVSTISNANKVYNRNGVIIFEGVYGYQVLKLTSSSPPPVYQPSKRPGQNSVPPFQRPGLDPIPPTQNWPYQPIFTTPVVLPGISSTSLKGTYFFKPTDPTFPTAIFTFDDDYIQFEGCNVNRLPYATYNDGVFCLLQGGSSTLRYCQVDYDGAYVQILSKTTRYQKTANGYDLYDQDQLVARLEKKVRNQIVKYNIIYGGYQLDIQGLDARVSQNTISFTGCNSVSIPYQRNSNSISFGNAISTLKFCDRDVDGVYLSAITRAVSLKQLDDGYAFIDAFGVQTIRFSFFDRQDDFRSKWFGGNFKIKLPNAGIRLKIGDGQFTLAGCNTHTFKFTLSDNGNIVFGVPASTEVACEVDNDSVFLIALLQAQSIAVVNTNILFFDANNELVVRATNFEQSGAKKDQPEIYDPKSPVFANVDYYFFQGTYKFSLRGTSLKTLSLTVTKDAISWQGCNIWNMKYIAATDGTVKFYPGPSTKRACQTDNDNLYNDALLSAVKYSEMKGMITFYDSKGKSTITFLYDAVASGTAPSTFTPSAPPQPTFTPSAPPQPTQQPRPVFKRIPDGLISLKGQYRFILPKINFDVVGDSFIYKGCNTHRIPCAFQNNNILFGQPISTNNPCPNNPDKIFLSLIPRVSRFNRQNNDVIFFDPSSQPVFRASTVVKKPELAAGISSGSYATEQNPADVNFDDNNFYFTDCSNNGFGYNAKNTGDFSVTAQGNPQACNNFQNFDIYSSAVNGVTKYRNIENGFVLQDNNGNQKARCIKP